MGEREENKDFKTFFRRLENDDLQDYVVVDGVSAKTRFFLHYNHLSIKRWQLKRKSEGGRRISGRN